MKLKISSLTFLFMALAILKGQTTTVRQYIDSFKNIAMLEMIESKIPASITLAQGILESGSGNSRLAKQGNNHFGIKCKKDWTGCSILEDDDALQECFRCYASAHESYKDHSAFLKNNRRYAGLFELEIADYKAWARGLLAAGYATNKKYADLLIGTIERNRLTEFDSLVLSGYNPNTPRLNPVPNPKIEIVYNKVPSVIVGENQNLEQIADLNNKSQRKISRYNDLGQHQEIKPGDVIYLKPKKRKASVSNHQVKPGETMWEISQKYAIRISALYKKNLMEPGTEPAAGVILNLQDRALARPDTLRTNRLNESEKTSQQQHIVKAGETLYSIANKYGLKVEDLKLMNNLSSEILSIGQVLILQKGATTSNKSIEYVVKQGDTLYSLSKKLGVRVDDLKSWNNLSSDQLSIGQVLKILQ